MDFNIEDFRIPSTVQPPPMPQPAGGPSVAAVTAKSDGRTRQKSPFVKGPISVNWLKHAGALSGKYAILTGLALHYQAGLEGSQQGIRLTAKLRDKFGLPSRSARRAISHLETAGLVTVKRHSGQRITVSIIDKP
jgi:hypothetical protein